MSALGDIGCLVYILGQYFVWRAGLRRQPPEVARYYVRGLHGLDAMFGWTRKTRVRGAENCPERGPAIFASNHIEIDDPFVTGALIHEVSGGIRPGAMMRDDFFRGIPRWLRYVLDPDEVSRFIGAAQISRQGVTPEQIEQFVDLLLRGECFMIYPGRSRTRSGLFFEYREWIRSPGRTSLFPSLVHKRDSSADVPVIPIARTYNLVTKRSCVAFGPAVYLEPGAGPVKQREFDYRLVCAIGELVEVNAAQLAGALFYLRSLHGLSARVDSDEVADALQDVTRTLAERNPARTIDPALLEHPDEEVAKVLHFLRKRSFLYRDGPRLTLNTQAILKTPASFSKYKSQNHVKYLANQVIHLGDVVVAVEERVLGRAPARRALSSAV